jgi:signal recognition particle receptor subunit beta
MAFVNYATKNVAIKVVYYGPGLSGKTTNLRYIYFKLDPTSRGEFICLETATERTFFFDLLPVKAGQVNDFKIHFQLMTVPGQVFYEASRKSVVKGADGIVFVADSQVALLDANIESFDYLRQNCLEHNMDLNDIPMVFQYNKRDLNNLIPIETFNNLLNPHRAPSVEASAINGVGVFETLKEISNLTVPYVKKKIFEAKEGEEEEKDKIELGPIEPKEEKKEEQKVEFVDTPSSIQLKKIRIKDQGDIDKEIQNLMKEFTSKKT